MKTECFSIGSKWVKVPLRLGLFGFIFPTCVRCWNSANYSTCSFFIANVLVMAKLHYLSESESLAQQLWAWGGTHPGQWHGLVAGLTLRDTDRQPFILTFIHEGLFRFTNSPIPVLCLPLVFRENPLLHREDMQHLFSVRNLLTETIALSAMFLFLFHWAGLLFKTWLESAFKNKKADNTKHQIMIF